MSEKAPKNLLKIGVVGMGVMGWQYCEVLRSLPQASLQWICDIDTERLEKSACHFKVKGYKDFKEAPVEEIDAVIIATPDNYHLEPTLYFAKNKKHILVEKPLATSVEDGIEMVKACKEADIKLMVGHILRFDPRYALVKERIEKKEIGDIVHFYARRNNLLSNAIRIKGRTSPIFFLAVHDIDILCWLKKSPPKWVYATANSKLLRFLNTFDTAFILLEWEDGTIACVETSWVLPDYSPSGLDSQLEVVGSEGAIYLRIDNQNLRIYKEKSEFPDTFYHFLLHNEPFGILRAEVEHFIDCVIGDNPPLIDGEEALIAVRIAEAAHKSIDLKERIEI
ncbi:Gfo/Idh/MocA family oxidoreductase [bacterium]|nr:Gfo/Idh/MocA family oxidoreductase [bacterium]